MRTPRTQRRLRGSGVRSSLLAYRSGFTLIELLVAITIFIILTTLTVATYAGSLEERLQTLRTMAEVVEAAGLA